MKEILKYLSAKHFFTDYANAVKNYTHKMRGKDGHGNPIEFSDNDKKLIAAGIKEMARDITRKISKA